MNGLRITLAAGVAAALACHPMFGAERARGRRVGARRRRFASGRDPIGDAQNPGHAEDTMSKSQLAMVPVWFDLGYRFSRTFYLAAFYQYGVTFPASTTVDRPRHPGLLRSRRRRGNELDSALRPAPLGSTGRRRATASTSASGSSSTTTSPRRSS